MSRMVSDMLFLAQADNRADPQQKTMDWPMRHTMFDLIEARAE
jgi:hypothetical protein